MNIAQFLSKKIRMTPHSSFSGLVIKIGISSVALAVAVILLSFFILSGFKSNIKNKLFGQVAHLQVSKITLNHSFEKATVTNNFEQLNQAKNLNNVSSVNKVALKSVILKSKTQIAGVVMKGVESNYDWSAFEANIILGEKPNLMRDSSSNAVLISSHLASNLELKIGDSFLAYFIQNPPRARKLKVSGIFDSGIEELDKLYILGDLNLVRKINQWEKGEFGHYEVFLKDIRKISQTQVQLAEIFPNEFQVLSVYQLLPQFFEWFQLLDRNSVLIVVLLVLVAGFNMVSVLLIMILERIPMVALLKCIGMPYTSIRNIFLSNGLIILLKGTFWGNTLALLIAAVQYFFKPIKLDPSNYYMSYVPVEWSWEVLFFVNIGVILLVLLMLFLPVLSIARLNIIKGLKFRD